MAAGKASGTVAHPPLRQAHALLTRHAREVQVGGNPVCSARVQATWCSPWCTALNSFGTSSPLLWPTSRTRSQTVAMRKARALVRITCWRCLAPLPDPRAVPFHAGQFIGNHIEDAWLAEHAWLHIDMAAPVKKGERATGYGVALVVEILRQMAAKPGANFAP